MLTEEDKKEIEEMLDKGSSEAPASVNVVAYYHGYKIQGTKRDLNTELRPYFEEAMKAVDWMMTQEGFKPSWADDTNGKNKPTEPTKPVQEVKDDLTSICPIHKVPMEQRTWTNPKGEVITFWSHSKCEEGIWSNCSGKGYRENTKGTQK